MRFFCCLVLISDLMRRKRQMKIKKILNNNAAYSSDGGENEMIVMGRGICFGKKQGEEIDPAKVEKVFRSKESNEQFMRLVEEMPYEEIKVADEIINYASERLGKRLCKNIYITLTDHLGFAVERKKQGLAIRNALLWEIKKYYSLEYEIGRHAVDVIRDRLGVELSEDEAGFFALHIVNAELDGSIHHTMVTPEIIKDILNIVRYSFTVEIDENSLSYERFITHLKYFLQRAEKNVYYPQDSNDIYEVVIRKFPDAYRCACRIKSYMELKYPQKITDDEMLYLTIHISRITGRQ